MEGAEDILGHANTPPVTLDRLESPLSADLKKNFFLFFFFLDSLYWANSLLVLPKRNLGIFLSAFVCFPNLLQGHVELVLMDHESPS